MTRRSEETLNAWRRARYSVYAFFYDLGPGFGEERRRAIEMLELRPGERVLVVGVGTGADLALLPRHAQVVAVDLTPAMLARARARSWPGVELRVMDAERLEVPSGSFDAVLLHQVLEVVADPVACLAEAARALRPGGRISVFDKFLADHEPHVLWKAAWARALDLVFTTVKHRFGDLLAASGSPLRIERSEPCRGAFRIVLLSKQPAGGEGPPADRVGGC